MSEVVFLTGVADKLAFARRLLRKKYQEGARVAVYGPSALLGRLDYHLWAADPTEFLPHLRLRDGQLPTSAASSRTRLWLLDRPAPLLLCDNAVNLGGAELAWLAAHERVAEVVGLNEDDRAEGRRRWRQYEAQGHTLSHRPQG